ncbi:MAG: PEGA domain-containing protein [Myxococcales bacterium]|nr:PEGA domain-containing protein [Myxococcales bacterium]
MNPVALALLPALALSAPPPTTKRIAVLLVPMDMGAEASTVKLEAYMNESLEQHRSYVLRKTDDLFGLPSDEQAEASLKRARTGFEESRLAFEAREEEDAERKLRATIKEYAKAAGAMKECGNLCDAVAMYAAVLHSRGEVEEAKIALLDLLALSPTYELDRKKFTQDFISFRAQVATSRSAQLRGNLNVKSRPAGARVYLDGEFQGYTPVSLQTLPIGKHVLRLERPGCKQHGAVVEVTPEEQEIATDLSPTPPFKAYDSLLDKLAQEVTREKGGATMASIAKTLNLDRGVVGTVKEINESGGLELLVGIFDLKAGKKLSGKKIIFQGDEYGQLKSEVGRLVNQLVNAADGGGEKLVKTSDPLEGRHGTEDWNAEDRGGGRTGSEKKRRGKDPLDSVSGTEEW